MSVSGGHVDHGTCRNCLRSAHLRGVRVGFVDTGGVGRALDWEEGGSFCLDRDTGSHCHLERWDWSSDNAGSRS